MPRGDGTGPRGRGAGTGTDRGAKRGSGRVGRMDGTRAGAGPGGQCVCPSCKAKIAHQLGTPCNQSKCPKCGAAMVRG
jgi:hypothetical protein